MDGLLLYKDEDFERNHWFATTIVKEARNLGIEIEIVVRDVYSDAEIFDLCNHYKVKFIINRTRNWKLSEQFEKSGVKSFNNSKVIKVCNDKWETYLLAVRSGIKAQKTIKIPKQTKVIDKNIVFPRIIKSLDGHGGTGVFLVNSMEELSQAIRSLDRDIIVQRPCDVFGKDLRVYVLGKRILGAVLRSSKTDFKANMSLGGDIEEYELSDEQRKYILNIADVMDFDYVGIDFLFNKDGELILNEIEDAVGSRSVYKLKMFNPIKEYLEYIKSSISLD